MPIPPSPFVTFIFTGLVAICFGNNNEYGQVGFHSVTNDHELRVAITKKQNQTVIGTVATYKISHEMLRDMPNIWVDIEGPIPPKQQTVEKFISGNGSYPYPDERDYRHIVDFEGSFFYNRQLTITPEAFKPSLYFAKGLFYTAVLSERPYQTICVDSNGMPVRSLSCPNFNLGRIADQIGVNLYSDHSSQALVLRVGKDGRELMRLKPEIGITYEIVVENTPTPETHSMDHFVYFYNGITLNPGDPRIIISPIGASTDGMEDGICASAGFGKSSSLGGGK